MGRDPREDGENHTDKWTAGRSIQPGAARARDFAAFTHFRAPTSHRVAVCFRGAAGAAAAPAPSLLGPGDAHSAARDIPAWRRVVAGLTGSTRRRGRGVAVVAPPPAATAGAKRIGTPRQSAP